MNRDEILSLLSWRYAVKKFDATKKISAEDWHVLAESLRLSPSSYGLQPWKFLVVQDTEIRKELLALSWGQKQVLDCSHYVVFLCPNKMTETHVSKFVTQTAKVRNIPEANLEAFRAMMLKNTVHITDENPNASFYWMQKQAYIAMGFLMETAAMLNIDTCPMEGLDPIAYDRALKLNGNGPEGSVNNGWRTIASVALGYRAADDKTQHLKKVRFDKDEIIEFI